MTYDLAIIGGGPAGAAAAVYAARKRLKTVLITRDWLGQSNVSEKIENWIGEVGISGLELSKRLETHVKAYASDVVDIREGESCRNIGAPTSLLASSELRRASKSLEVRGKKINTKDEIKTGFEIKTDKNSYEARAILIASGSHRRRLEIPGADTYEHKGLTYCATCDGPMYSDQDVVVVGGGNAAFESAAQLLAYCKSVTIMNRSDRFKADPGTIEKVSSNPKAKVLTFAIPKEVKGTKFLESITYTDGKTKKDVELKVTGVFVEIGSLPNTDFAKEVIKLDEFNRVPIDFKTQATETSGIWAAGDCTDGLYHQNNIAAGDAVKAIEDIYMHLKAR
ncbi:MAG: FAD-dependent oxidoreductase [Candidatus Paceibacterota bacterium]